MQDSFFDTLPQRCVDLAYGDKKRIIEILRFAKKMGFKTRWCDPVLFIDGYVNTGIPCSGDPVTILVSCLFAFAGSMWAMIPECQGYLKELNKLWKERAKQEKESDEKK